MLTHSPAAHGEVIDGSKSLESGTTRTMTGSWSRCEFGVLSVFLWWSSCRPVLRDCVTHGKRLLSGQQRKQPRKEGTLLPRCQRSAINTLGIHSCCARVENQTAFTRRGIVATEEIRSNTSYQTTYLATWVHGSWPLANELPWPVSPTSFMQQVQTCMIHML